MNYFLKKFPQLPYTVTVILSLVSWGVLCAFLGSFLILSQADFAATGTRNVFIFTFMLTLIFLGSLPPIIEYGGFGVKPKKEFQVLNENIKKGHISPDISTEALKEVFFSFVNFPKDCSKISFKYGCVIIFSCTIAEYIASGGMTTNLLTIFVSGLLVASLLSVSSIVFTQDFISPVFKKCRRFLIERGEKVKEPHSRLNDLRTKLSLSFIIPFLVCLVICLLFKLELRIVMFASASLIMAVLISRVLSFSISQAFLEIKDFANRFSGDERLFFSTGSLSLEVIDLSNDLNRAAEEVYASRTKIERSKLELKERAEELEKWKELIVGRKSKMAELKKEKRELRTKLKNKQ